LEQLSLLSDAQFGVEEQSIEFTTDDSSDNAFLMPSTEVASPENFEAMESCKDESDAVDLLTTTVADAEELAPYKSKMSELHTKPLPLLEEPAGSWEEVWLASDRDCSTMTRPEEDETKPNWYVRGVSSSTHWAALNVKTSSKADPTNG
jgi:hypothetical protein